MLCELETDKVTVEVPSPAAGTLGDIVAPEGETVGVNALLATIAEGAAAAPAKAAEKADAKPEAAVTQTEAGPETPEPREARRDVEDAPAAKKAMAEAGLSRDQVEGTGRDGRVMKEDVAKALAAATQKTDAPAPAPRAPVPAEDAAREERVTSWNCATNTRTCSRRSTR